MKFSFTPQGVCSRVIHLDIEDGVITDLSFEGGCNGNLQGVSRLAIGRKADDIIELLSGIQCGLRPTSCPDQLTKALRKALAAQSGSAAS
ncbi:TIGR03905 family TSCPD domain-containing protein [Ruminococcaceae bacterium OttesenSCG-928-L11]|nr:TIGR03905 family TSCPD domain-containing protein [Ruminococcaceae bacterium OttesenSCG-928-L11]